MKFSSLTLALLPFVAANKKVRRREQEATATYMPGHFDWGFHIRDSQGRKVRVANGVMGRAVAEVGQPVQFDDGSVLKDVVYHERADGGGIIPKTDGSDGYYYLSNSENGGYPEDFDPNADRSTYAGNLTGGVWSLEFNSVHDFIGYKQILDLTADNCAGGTTPWGTWVSCEEEKMWGRCWQCDPEGIIPAQATAVTNPAYYGITDYGNWEGFAWDESTGHGYTTDDDHPGNEAGPHYGAQAWKGAVVRFTPDAAATECWNKETKAERWCTLNSGSFDYLKLNPTLGGSNGGAFEWVEISDSTPELYRKGEGIHIEDGTLTFVAKEDRHVFRLNLNDGTYVQNATPASQQPDNIRGFGGTMYYCTDGGTPNAIWADDGTGTYKIVEEITYDSEAAGVAFSPDGKLMYMSWQTGATWQFWREDGLRWDDATADVKYTADAY